MATRRSAKSKPKKAVKKAARKPVKRASAAKPAATASPGSAIRFGVITHTEIASENPEATKTWLASALGWKFGPPAPTPTGPYHMWRFEKFGTGGGIRTNNPPEPPGSVPYVEVKDIRATYQKALSAGATAMVEPTPLPDNMGAIAVVSAPGGVTIGFWSMK